MDSSLYRPCAGLAILNSRGEVLVGKRADGRFLDAWQLPQGGIDAGEDPYTAALRELYEETGLSPHHVKLLHEIPEWLHYDLPSDLQASFWGGRYVGQRQKWFIWRFLGKDSEVNLTAHVPPEFIAWKWASPADLPEMIVPFKRQIYSHLAIVIANIPSPPVETSDSQPPHNQNRC